MLMTILGDLQDFFFPCYCMGCGIRLEENRKFLCPKCFDAMPKYGGLENFYRPWERVEGHLPMTEYQSDLIFTPTSMARKLVHNIKYNGYPELGRALARHFAIGHHANGHFVDVSAIVPIPLAPHRMWKRGYNQSAFIAQGISDVYGVPVEEGFLARRWKAFGTQTTRGRRERWQHLEDVFYVPDGVNLQGRRLLIVDDLLTTGATLVNAAIALRTAGVESVSFYTLAVDILL